MKFLFFTMFLFLTVGIHAQIDTAKSNLYYNKGFEKFKRKEYNEAIIEFNESIRFNPKNTKAYLKKSSSECSLRLIDESIKTLQFVFAYDTTNSLAYECLGDSYAGKKMYEKTILNYKISFKYNKRKKSLIYKIGYVYYLMNLYKNAIDYLNDYLEVQSSNPILDAYKYRGYSYLQLLNYEKCIDDLNKCDKGDTSKLNLNRGISHYKTRKLNLALEDLTKYTTKYPYSHEGNRWLAAIYFDLKDYTKAYELYVKTMQLDSLTECENFYGLGYSAMILNKNKESIASYLAYNNCNPNDKQTNYLLAEVYFKENDTFNALKYYDLTSKIDSDFRL